MANQSNPGGGGSTNYDPVIDNQYFVYGTTEEERKEAGIAEETRENALVNKYKAMANMRRDYEDISIKDCIPTLDEMIQDDLMYEIMEKASNGETEKDVLSTSYYSEALPNTKMGYDEKNKVFFYKVSSADISKADIDLNKIDGSTFYLPVNNILDSGSNGFSRGGKDYNSFIDYCEKSGLINGDYNDPKIQIKLAGINCPTVPRYEIQLMKKEDIVTMTVGEAKQKGAVIEKYVYSKGKVSKRTDDNKKKEFYKIKKNNKDHYYEIIGDGSSYAGEAREGYAYKKIVIEDESIDETSLVQGYRAKDNLVELLKKDNIYIMLDANGAQGKKTSSQYNLYYNHWWNVGSTIVDMIEQWRNFSNESQLTKLTYSPYGTDGFGRFVGAVYVPNGNMYTNAAKYNIADSETGATSNSSTGSTEMNNVSTDSAAIFELYNYEKNNMVWLDSFNEMTKEHYRKRIEFHKEITGLDFTKLRNCTMMIGDTLFLIPPQNIRSLSSIEYEKVSIMRGKGSMVKNNTNRDMYLEIDLYFYNDAGINGIPVDVNLPNKSTVTYYMNGLRSLIAQFKLAPYLPIENQFVNDVLNIEAVSLVNLNVSTVEGMPRLLQATLTLRDFNYRIYMPDIPINYGSAQISEITEMDPIFAKCFNWEVFRFYYQRIISFGNAQKEYAYNSEEYNKEVYSTKEALQPVFFCEKDGFGASDISFYTPDENWLKEALSIKKDKDYNGQDPINVELTENGKEIFKKIASVADKLKVNTTYAERIVNNFKIDYTTPLGKKVTRSNVLEKKNSLLEYVGNSNKNVTPQSASNVSIPANIEDMFSGYKKISVDGGNLSGSRQKNAVVDIGFGDRQYWAFTNSYGQVVKVVAKNIVVQDDSKEPVNEEGRYYDDQADVPGTERADLDKGHIIADSLGGVANAYNITPQNLTLNREGKVWQIEDEIRKAGGCTDFVVVITYPSTSTQIPSHYSYAYTLKGSRKTIDFANEEPGTKQDYNKDTMLSDMILDVANNINASGVLKYKTTDEELDISRQTMTWKLNFDFTAAVNENDMLFIKETLKNLMNTSTVLKDNRIVVTITTDIKNSRNITSSFKVSSPEISAIASQVEGSDPTANVDEYDYRDASKMQFVPYLQDVELESLRFSLTNNFSDITLKVMDGFAPQYMGSSDITIDVSLVTTNEMVVSMLNVLPAHAANIGKIYRRILSCWPIRVRNHYLQMAGINEVLIDLVEIQTMQGFPGVYEVHLKMTSVDRTMRQRETMKQLESDKKSSAMAVASMYSYWDVENVLSQAELYPDLALPSIKELNEYGFQFIRYRNTRQAYPDPDFYMIYGYPYTSYIIKKNLKDVFYNNIFHDEGKEKSEILDETSYKFFDQMGMELYRKLDPNKGTTEGAGPNGEKQNDLANCYDEALCAIDEGSTDTVRKTKKQRERDIEERDCSDLADLLIYLTACDIQEGWTLKPGFTAPVVVSEINNDVAKLSCSGVSGDDVSEGEKTNAYAKDVFETRKAIIQAIDEYLSNPIDYSRYNITSQSKLSDSEDYESGCGGVIQKVVELFANEAGGVKILQLLNPFENNWKVTNTNASKKTQKDSGKTAYDSSGKLTEIDEDDMSGSSPQSNPNLDDGPKPGEKDGESDKKVPQSNPNLDDGPKPGEDDPDDTASPKANYEKANTINFFAGFIYAAAKCITAEDIYDSGAKNSAWEPRQFKVDSWGRPEVDSEGNRIPNCMIERNNKNPDFANSLKEALEQGTKWGMFQIKRYRASELKKIMKPTSKVQYLDGDKIAMYKDPKTGKERWHPGFIDPYYNIAGYRSKIGKEYIEKIATNEGINTIAFIRNVLMHLRRMLIDGQIISEIDIVAKDYKDIKDTITIEPNLENIENAAEQKGKELKEGGLGAGMGPLDLVALMVEQGPIDGVKQFFGQSNDWGELSAVDAIAQAVGSTEDAEQLIGLLEDIPDTYRRSFCSRLVYPVLLAASENNKHINNLIDNYQLNELNSMTTGIGAITSNPTTIIGKYCKGMYSIGMLSFNEQKTDPETTSDSQKMWNYIMKEAYTKLADDPQAYVLHSYYDMLINDKRGRLIRAFPTYYIIFMDEGRKIGSWKLFDNFYNMNAVAEITVTKSRKIPADTCSFVMSNMYNSFAAEYDNTTKQQYVDIYGLRDVFNSIFCPETYFIKEDALRRRKEISETVVLQPGVRIHVRMGYGADASRLPIAFNGKIAEIDVGDVVQVLAQGDTIELCNPLNALGETDAVELTESQQWTTLFKDIRGSLKRGGESPRNLLAKLLTAQYGGVLKTAIRELSDERWFGDNPFGIYHFGDKRFNTVFEEGEAVQNLYEVCDANLLKGVNELYPSRENSMATPTINTTLQDKTFWDILHLCANSGVNYMGAVRDFGMRSTVCLCKPNHYYAYAYKKIDDHDGQSEGKIVERRKPFQQFHFYDSYTDIVHNSIKASEKNIKTNAVGLWESTDMFWGKSQSTVGPIYLDFNIYPEHQKSMTVDTTLISDGEGGLELNLITHFSEKWAVDEKDTKVNKALAERVTTNVLRESVSNMYCGELCVLGDTSIKPYDRFYVNDCYEDMMGYMEVEGVVFSMNSSTGFTTTIFPDAIVRSDDAQEPAKRMVNGTFVASCAIAGTGRLMAINTFARMDSALIKALSASSKLLATPADEMAATWGATALGKFLHIDKFGTVKEAAGAALQAGISTASIITTAVAAIGIYVCAQNTKSWIGSFLKHINALTVYPIIKNKRPLIAGMAGHKGSVYGYPYTEKDTDDSIQGLITNCVHWLNGGDKYDNVFPFNFGDALMSALTPKVDDGNGNMISEYEKIKRQWAQTLPIDGMEPGNFDFNDPNATFEEKREALMQTLYTPACLEFGARDSKIQFLRTKYRLPSLEVDKEDKTADEVYKRYHIADVATIKQLATSKKVLALYPIEDELEIKQAVIKKTHPVVKQLHIAHSQGNAKVQMPFESGNRIIKLFTEQGNEDTYVYDLPMLQEDALMIFKMILNHTALTNKQVSFLSGTRVNDLKTWRSTGFAFIIDSEDKGALEQAIKGVMEETKFYNGKNDQAIFEYKAISTGFLIIVYAPKDTYIS